MKKGFSRKELDLDSTETHYRSIIEKMSRDHKTTISNLEIRVNHELQTSTQLKNEFELFKMHASKMNKELFQALQFCESQIVTLQLQLQSKTEDELQLIKEKEEVKKEYEMYKTNISKMNNEFMQAIIVKNQTIDQLTKSQELLRLEFETKLIEQNIASNKSNTRLESSLKEKKTIIFDLKAKLHESEANLIEQNVESNKSISRLESSLKEKEKTIIQLKAKLDEVSDQQKLLSQTSLNQMMIMLKDIRKNQEMELMAKNTLINQQNTTLLEITSRSKEMEVQLSNLEAKLEKRNSKRQRRESLQMQQTEQPSFFTQYFPQYQQPQVFLHPGSSTTMFNS